MNRKPRLYVDFDGTACEFKMVGPDVYSAPGYSLTLRPHDHVIHALKYLIQKGLMDVYLCSAVLPFEHCIKDKDEWLDMFLPELEKEKRIYMPVGENKADYISLEKGDVFLDDWNNNLKDIKKTAAEPVKLINDINDVNKSWTGARVSKDSDSETIALTLFGISLATMAA